jgi:CheY-like chemotaxis protein
MPHAAASVLPGAGPIRILIVEDETLIRFALAEELRALDVLVIEAATADEALDFLAVDNRIDLVFTDHRMPGSMTGAQLAHRVRDAGHAPAVIVTSADIEPGAWPEPIVRKPYELAETATMLLQIARANRPPLDGA